VAQKNPLKGRLVYRKERQARVKIPFIQDLELPSLKGRIHPLPKSAFWRRMSGWPITKPEEGQIV
jgi:hypothetical protein